MTRQGAQNAEENCSSVACAPRVASGRALATCDQVVSAGSTTEGAGSAAEGVGAAETRTRWVPRKRPSVSAR